MSPEFKVHEFIAERRDALPHTKEDLFAFAQLAGANALPDYQISAWLMAAFLNQLSPVETAYLTEGMARSGEMLDLGLVPGPHVDKHSTGGVGDKTTIVLLPMLSALGMSAVKMSGRGLGITGGTLDKLSSVPGFRLNLSPSEMVGQARRIRICLSGQSKLLAPADKTLYALRDSTETVASIPLIVSSILSKKIAAGAEIISLDVKAGSGAFMKTTADAEKLKDSLIATGAHLGLKVHAEVTDMDQPLGSAVGNAIEVHEAIRVLETDALNGPESRFARLCVHLAATTMLVAGLESDYGRASVQASQVLQSGSAAEKAREWFHAQGAHKFEAPIEALPETVITATQSGKISRIDAGQIGHAVLELGGGRKGKDDVVDLQVGALVWKSVGDPVEKGEPVVTLRHRDDERAKIAESHVNSAIQISES